jgi:hypothetical protein
VSKRQDAEWSHWSDREIAKHAKVHHEMVGRRGRRRLKRSLAETPVSPHLHHQARHRGEDEDRRLAPGRRFIHRSAKNKGVG